MEKCEGQEGFVVKVLPHSLFVVKLESREKIGTHLSRESK